jgi:hypothetical protein
MSVDKVFANSKFLWNSECGDTRQGKGGTLKILTVEDHSQCKDWSEKFVIVLQEDNGGSNSLAWKVRVKFCTNCTTIPMST